MAANTIRRRDMLKAMGVAVALLPVVTSIVAPTPVQAQTCVPNCGIGPLRLPQGFQNCQEYGEAFFEDAPEGILLCSVESIDNDGTVCIFNYYDLEGCEENGNADSLRWR